MPQLVWPCGLSCDACSERVPHADQASSTVRLHVHAVQCVSLCPPNSLGAVRCLWKCIQAGRHTQKGLEARACPGLKTLGSGFLAGLCFSIIPHAWTQHSWQHCVCWLQGPGGHAQSAEKPAAVPEAQGF